MTRLQFRVYSYYDKRYLPLVVKDSEIYINAFGQVRYNKQIDNLPCLPQDELRIELFTGFYDKNKKQIYDGDIVGLYDIDGNICEKRRVVFENAGFVLKHQKAIYGDIPLANLYQIQKELDNIDSKTLRDIEVIGNIHENSELLNY